MRGGKRPGAGRPKGHTDAITIRISKESIFQLDDALVGVYERTRSLCIQKLILEEIKRERLEIKG